MLIRPRTLEPCVADRPSVDQYFMDMTHLVKARGTCPRRQVGAVIVKDKRVLTTGYNGAPRNFPHPIEVGCLRDELHIPKGMMADICPCLHAEQNAIIQAATTGVSIEGAELYCTTQPCTQCSRMIANCGMKRVVFEEEYPDPLAIGIMTTSGVELCQWNPQTQQAEPYAKTNTFEEAQDALRRKWAAGEAAATPRQFASPLPMAGQFTAPLRTAGTPRSPPVASHAPTPPRPALTRTAPLPARSESTTPPRLDLEARDATEDTALRLDDSRGQVGQQSHADGPQGHGEGQQGHGEESALPPEPRARGLRDLRNDPAREDIIRRLAREKVDRQKRDRGEP